MFHAKTFAFVAALALAAPALAADLAAEFRSPPAAVKPHTWWHWMDGNVTREGITADLEAMQRVGIGGVQIFDVGQQIPEGPIKYASPEWHALTQFAIKEGARLGLEIGLHNCSGWSSTGGPWVTPDMGMQTVVVTDSLQVKGGSKVTATLPPPFLAGNLAVQSGVSKYPEYYHDIAILACRTTSSYRLPNWPMKAVSTDVIRNLSWETETPAGAAVKHEEVVDVTDKVAGGTLTWDAPAGDWTILRIGYAPNGRQNKPPTQYGRGLEIDKMNRKAVDLHFQKLLDVILKDAGPLAGKSKTLTTILVDSYEAGVQNWTPGFREEFQKRRGYDMLAYMPAFSGRIVDSADVTERFLFDVRTTVAELFHANYYTYFRDECHKRGIQIAIEPYDGPFDTLDVGTLADLSMSEFWNRRADSSTRTRYVASAAHLSGHEIIGAESFTSQYNEDKYTTDPFSLKVIGDYQFCEGINRLIFHRFAHQPWIDPHGPGMTMGPWGFHMDRTNTWWEQSRTWIEYLTRCQYLLQAGKSTADVLCFSGEQQLTHSRWNGRETPPLPLGYDYEFASTALLKSAKVEDGRIVMPSGLSFRLLLLPDYDAFTPEALAAIERLVNAGATVVGPKPLYSTSLVGYPKSDQDFRRTSDAMWGDINGTSVTRHAYGKGQVFGKIPLATVLDALAVKPDFNVAEGQQPHYVFKHRVLPEGDVYFISNQLNDAQEIACAFRVTGKMPELFHPDTGETEPVPQYQERDGRTSLGLSMGPAGSVFVVFRKPAAERVVALAPLGAPTFAQQFHITQGPTGYALTSIFPASYEMTLSSGKKLSATVGTLPAPAAVGGPWKVDFQPQPAAPASATFDRLISWPESPDEGIKYFSGTATYSREMNVPATLLAPGTNVYLDLGQVKNLAEVRINGQDLGTLWKPPFRVSAAKVLHPGVNQLEVRITNLWANRLIGDENLPDDVEWVIAGRGRGAYLKEWPEWLVKHMPRPSGRLAFSTWKFYDKGAALLPSGLLGPVTLQPEGTAEFK